MLRELFFTAAACLMTPSCWVSIDDVISATLISKVNNGEQNEGDQGVVGVLYCLVWYHINQQVRYSHCMLIGAEAFEGEFNLSRLLPLYVWTLTGMFSI